MIKNVAILKKVAVYNKHHNKNYYTKEGVMIIEKEDNSRIILDLESGADITDSDYLEVKIIKGKTKVKYLFQNALLNAEEV